jgi:hypothetical protein
VESRDARDAIVSYDEEYEEEEELADESEEVEVLEEVVCGCGRAEWGRLDR